MSAVISSVVPTCLSYAHTTYFFTCSTVKRFSELILPQILSFTTEKKKNSTLFDSKSTTLLTRSSLSLSNFMSSLLLMHLGTGTRTPHPTLPPPSTFRVLRPWTPTPLRLRYPVSTRIFVFTRVHELLLQLPKKRTTGDRRVVTPPFHTLTYPNPIPSPNRLFTFKPSW